MRIHKLEWKEFPWAVLCKVFTKDQRILSSPRDEDVTCKNCLHGIAERKLGCNIPYGKGGQGRKPWKNMVRGEGEGI